MAALPWGMWRPEVNSEEQQREGKAKKTYPWDLCPSCREVVPAIVSGLHYTDRNMVIQKEKLNILWVQVQKITLSWGRWLSSSRSMYFHSLVSSYVSLTYKAVISGLLTVIALKKVGSYCLCCAHCNADWMPLHQQWIWLPHIRCPFDKYCCCNVFAQGEDLSLKNIYLIYLHIILHSPKTCWQHSVILQCQLLQGCELSGCSVLHRNEVLAVALPFGCLVAFHQTRKHFLDVIGASPSDFGAIRLVLQVDLKLLLLPVCAKPLVRPLMF